MISQEIVVTVGGGVFVESKLVIAKGLKYALIGRNGVGKSSLLKFIVQTFPKTMAVLCEQEPIALDLSAIETVMSFDEKTTLLLAESEHSDTTDERLAEIYEEMADLNTDACKSKAISILIGLGFSTEMIYMSAVNLSGGYRIRLSLAKALYLNPPLLLLDEPSNHLDLNASIWLIDYLSRLKSTIVVVSHSIALIDDVCDTIILLDEKKLTYYRGNYTSYKTMRDQRAAKSVKARARVKNARERLPKIAFENFDDIPMGPLISMHNVSFAYLSTNPIFTNVNFGLYKETKMALVGPNGAGKTTFLKLLNETVTPTAGYVSFNRKITIGTFNQHSIDHLNLSVSATQWLTDKYGISVQEAREALGKFGLVGKQHVIAIENLSGGQKARVAFADMFCNKPDALFLDEPTNNLDLESIDALQSGLKHYNSAIVLISHDERIIRNLECELWLVDDGIVKFDGSFQERRVLRAR